MALTAEVLNPSGNQKPTDDETFKPDMLNSIAQVEKKISEGKRLLLAGSEAALSQLPQGAWIGGTTPYFMDADGGVCSDSQIFVNEVPECAAEIEIRDYTTDNLHSICLDTPDNGYSFLIIPAGSAIHVAYAQNAPSYRDVFLKPIVGWVAGVHVSRIGQNPPKVFNGLTGEVSSERAAVMHVQLPADRLAELNIMNVFWPGRGDTITFPNLGFDAKECSVNGKRENFAEYIARVKPDPHVPLTVDHNGSVVNVSIQSVNEANGTVKFYAPVFPGLQYKFAESVSDYVAAFESLTQSQGTVAFSCNCILNYLYANLEGKRTGTITGPITFGEIAHQLLNQTLVQLVIYGAL